MTALDLFVFTAAAVVSRGLRFYAEAALLWYFGPPIRTVIEGNLGWLTAIFFVVLIGGFVAVKFLL